MSDTHPQPQPAPDADANGVHTPLFGSFPDGWKDAAEAAMAAGAIQRHRSRGSISLAGRKLLRTQSVCSTADKQTLCGVTAYHSPEEIKAALDGCKGGAKRRLEGIELIGTMTESFGEQARRVSSMRTGSPLAAPRPTPGGASRGRAPSFVSEAQALPEARGDAEVDAEEPLDEDVEILLDELQDRENQLLQAVELGAGLLAKLEDEKVAAAEREADMQATIDMLSRDVRRLTTETRDLRVSAMYLANVEEELVGKTVENTMLQDERRNLKAQAAEGETYKWLHGRYKEEGQELDERERTQEELAKELKVKQRELAGWQARAARTDRVQCELEEAEVRNDDLEREIRRLKRLVAERDSAVYGLKCQLRDRERAWEKEATEASLLRLKREVARSKQVVTHYKDTIAALRDENHSLEARLERMTKMASTVTLQQQQLVFSQAYADQITSEITALKEECFDEMDMWMKAVTDVAKDNRCQGEVLRRLRNENTTLRDTIRMHEASEHDRMSHAVRSHIVSKCNTLNRDLNHLKDYARSVKSQAAVRQVTEKEIQHLSNNLSTTCKGFLTLLQLMLSPSEKQQVGITLSETNLAHGNESAVSLGSVLPAHTTHSTSPPHVVVSTSPGGQKSPRSLSPYGSKRKGVHGYGSFSSAGTVRRVSSKRN